jgi:lipid-binding SYLF domain-containing protein
MTSEALREFRSSSGWTAGASIRYVLSDKKGSYDVNTDSVRYPVVGVVFAQTGLIAGATVEGTKYTRIIP